MEQTFRNWGQGGVGIGFKGVVAKSKKGKQTIDQKGLQKFKRINFRDFYSQELIHVAFISELEIFWTILYRLDKMID
jgi:hypothetical protein